jgi:hypothetical protein
VVPEQHHQVLVSSTEGEGAQQCRVIIARPRPTSLLRLLRREGTKGDEGSVGATRGVISYSRGEDDIRQGRGGGG